MINKSVFTFDNSDNCHPDLKKFRSRFCAHHNITELKYLSSNFFNLIKDFNFYQIIRSPYERFWSCLRLYFDHNRIDYSRLNYKEIVKIVNNLLNKTTSHYEKYKNSDLIFFKKQSEYFDNTEKYKLNFFLLERIDEIEKVLNKNQMTFEIKKKFNESPNYFNKIDILEKNINQKYLKIIKIMFHKFKLSKFFQKNSKKYLLEILKNEIEIINFIDDFYKEDINLYNKIKHKQ